MTSTENTLETTIRHHLLTISSLWDTSWLICYKLARQPGSTHLSGHASSNHDGLPLNPALYDQLSQVETIVRLAAYATGIADPQSTPTATLAHNVAQKAGQLASMADANEWNRDLTTAARVVASACVEEKVDPSQWYAVRMEWKPEQVATLLTQLTGRPVTGGQVKNLRRRGHISVSEGKACLGDVVSALEHHGQK